VQTDDAAPFSNLQEPEYDVEVQLSDLQKDTEHPLGSAASFAELGLSVRSPIEDAPC
jgi:ATP-dependent RNA helicase DDX19/DBP5